MLYSDDDEEEEDNNGEEEGGLGLGGQGGNGCYFGGASGLGGGGGGSGVLRGADGKAAGLQEGKGGPIRDGRAVYMYIDGLGRRTHANNQQPTGLGELAAYLPRPDTDAAGADEDGDGDGDGGKGKAPARRAAAPAPPPLPAGRGCHLVILAVPPHMVPGELLQFVSPFREVCWWVIDGGTRTKTGWLLVGRVLASTSMRMCVYTHPTRTTPTSTHTHT